MNYIVMDLEFNQPFDFAKNTKKKPNPEIPFEIIQIGCIKLNEKFEKIETLNLLIKPKVYKRIHPFVSKITGFNQAALNAGVTFEDAFEKLIDFVDVEESVFCVWGDVDLKLLFKNVAFYKLNNEKLPKKYINLQKIASKKLGWGAGRLIGLKNAIEKLEIEISNPFHDAFNDAVYTSLVMQKIDISNEDINVYTIDKKSKKQEQQQNELTDLYSYVEKELGRKLVQKEKKLYKNVYMLGVYKKFGSGSKKSQ